ncbi:hypothetical protein ACOME3_006609 [Neoechinorhynchus agilis]
MRTNVLAEGGKRPPTSLRIPVPPEVRSNILKDMKRDKQPSITDSGSNPTSQFLLEGSLSDEIPQQLTSSFKTQREYLALPVKRWPYILTIKSNPIMPKDVIYNQSVAPWTRSLIIAEGRYQSNIESKCSPISKQKHLRQMSSQTLSSSSYQKMAFCGHCQI